MHMSHMKDHERLALLKYLLQVGAAVVEPTPRGLRDPAFDG
jgi:hypothetical protein